MSTHLIPKHRLVHGMYYQGVSHNATIARWHGPLQRFIHWHYEFDTHFLQAVPHVADADEQGFAPTGWIRPVPDTLFENFGKEPEL